MNLLLSMILVAVFIPIIGCLGLHYGAGGKINGLAIGFVNNEIKSIDECYNKTLTTTEFDARHCTLHKASCEFVKLLGVNFINVSIEFRN